jgi:polyvinyl alcohol dehydrogenase (cytochrome)
MLAVIRSGGALLLAYLLLAAAAVKAAEMPPPRGEALYGQACAFCHDAGVPKAPARAALGMMEPAFIYQSLTTGQMTAQASHLDDAERRALAEFLTGRKLDAATTAIRKHQCADVGDGWFDRRQLPATQDPARTAFTGRRMAGLTARDVPQLQLDWAFAYPGAVRARSTPSPAGGALFVGSQDGTVYALDAKSGCVHWRYVAEAEVRTAVVVAPWLGTDATAPLAYFGDLAGNVYAVEATTGRLRWKLRADEHPAALITASPTFHEGRQGPRLYVPVSSLEVLNAVDPKYGCCTFRGAILALDARTGAVAWKTYTIPETPTARGTNSVGVTQYGPSGAAVWNSPTIDAKRNALYVGTGQNYSSPANDRSDAVLALDLDDGHLLWRTQPVPGDAWNVSCFPTTGRVNCPVEDGPDLDFGSSPMLVRTRQGREVIVAGRKSGDLYGLNPDARGEILWHRKLGRGSTLGGIHFGMAAEGSTVFVPIHDQEFSEAYLPPGDATIEKYFPGPGRAGLYAIDAATGATRWSAPLQEHCRAPALCQGYSAAIAAIPGVVLAGANDGQLRAYDSRNGRVLWSFDTRREFTSLDGEPARGGSIAGRPGPVVYDGRVYLNSGYDGLRTNAPGNVLLVFKVVSGPRP